MVLKGNDIQLTDFSGATQNIKNKNLFFNISFNFKPVLSYLLLEYKFKYDDNVKKSISSFLFFLLPFKKNH